MSMVRFKGKVTYCSYVHNNDHERTTISSIPESICPNISGNEIYICNDDGKRVGPVYFIKGPWKDPDNVK